MRTKLVSLVIVFVFLCGGLAFSEDREINSFNDYMGYLFDWSGDIGLTAEVAGAIPRSKDSDGTVYLGGSLTYDLINCFGIGLSSGWARWKARSAGLDIGYLNSWPVTGDLYPKLPIPIPITESYKIKLVPYAVIGFGAIFWFFEESSVLKDASVSVSVDPCFAMKYGGGLELFVTENIALFGEGSYLWSDTSVEASGGTLTVSETVDTDMWIVGGGIKYVF